MSIKDPGVHDTAKPALTFTLTQEQYDKARKWIVRHIHDVRTPRRTSFLFALTGIGTIEQVVCDCGAKLDLTDLSRW